MRFVAKKQYKITHKESLVGWYYVEANSEQEAFEEWWYMLDNGKVDFSDLELIDSSDTVSLNERAR